MKIVILLSFSLFCNSMSSTVLTCLAHANYFLCNMWMSIYNTSATKVFEKLCNMDIYIRPWLLVVQLNIMERSKCPNWAAKEIHIQQPNIYKNLLYEDVYIRPWLLAKYMKDVYVRPWLLALKYFGHTRNSKRTDIYVFGCWSADRAGAGKAHEGRIYMSLAVGKIRSARKGLIKTN